MSHSAKSSSSAPNLTGQGMFCSVRASLLELMSMLAKLDQVTKLMETLTSDLSHVNLLPHRQHSLPTEEYVLKLTPAERDANLEQLKILGREPANADPIFTKQVSCVRSAAWLETDLDQGH